MNEMAFLDQEPGSTVETLFAHRGVLRGCGLDNARPSARMTLYSSDAPLATGLSIGSRALFGCIICLFFVRISFRLPCGVCKEFLINNSTGIGYPLGIDEHVLIVRFVCKLTKCKFPRI